MRVLTKYRMHAAVTGVCLAAVLWYIMFVPAPFDFWLMMSVCTAALGSAASAFIWPPFTKDEFTLRHLLIGVGSAVGLYLVFLAGNHFLTAIDGWLHLPFLDPERQVQAVYANRGNLPPALVAALLFFPIGFGEELFWRRFVQKTFSDRYGHLAGYLIVVTCYTAVHCCCANPIMLLAALACGLVWGGIYWKTGSIVPVLISHMIWDPLIFVILPIPGTGT